MKLKKKTKIILIVVAVLVVLLLAWLLISYPGLIWPVLVTLLILGVGFFALDFWSRAKRKKKQRAFDEKVSAKEGIEDRKREWQGWVDELEKQGIDRYELPFYLVVGEPQSGKSVLLQNSDLYFPFGQERLSGVGGTRGCDWWFTDEAVILDIAGRLFTHEGGVADKMEWESFLDQLNEFRPMSPANGVLLVIPCDALLEDSPEVCAEKANKIQSALLTLTQKLEAQLPVYLVLTKGDRIFGFAESVHRMDSEQRHQMFGWSRETDKAEQPFVLDEAKAGFSRLVDRARLLRERMISTARLPEALPEIDRLYAFPDELAGMYGSLEIYLKRIFTESNLVDRASFRGIYLTSGLQTGAPIAKVCADLLGDDRESDARALEGLFSHQRAYFIKDLVRKRVFAERGLVRPTEGRVSSARRKAVLGYGAASVMALAAVIGGVTHVALGADKDAEQVLRKAVKDAKGSVDASSVAALLTQMGSIDKAVQQKRGFMEEIFGSTRDDLRAVYIKIGEKRLMPVLRSELERAVLAKIGTREAPNEPEDSAEALTWVRAVQALVGDVDFGDAAGSNLVKAFMSGTVGRRGAENYSVEAALSEYSGDWVSRVGDDKATLRQLVARGQQLLDGCLDAGNSWSLGGHVGYMVSMIGADKAFLEIQGRKRGLIKNEGLLEQCDVFVTAVGRLNAIGPGLDMVTFSDFRSELNVPVAAFGAFEEFRNPVEEQRSKWKALDDLIKDAYPIFLEHPGDVEYVLPSFLSGYAGRMLDNSFSEYRGAESSAFKALDHPWLTDPALEDSAGEPHHDWNLKDLLGGLTNDDGERRRKTLYEDRIKELAREFPSRIKDWEAAQRSYYGASETPPEGKLDQKVLNALVLLYGDLVRYDLLKLTREAPSRKGVEAVAKLVADYLKGAGKLFSSGGSLEDLDATVVSSLQRIVDSKLPKSVRTKASSLIGDYLSPFEQQMLNEWGGLDDDCGATLEIIAGLNKYLLELGVAPGNPVDLGGAHTDWLEDVAGELGGRLAKHRSAYEAHWRVGGEWGERDFGEVLEEAAGVLTRAKFDAREDTDSDRRVGDPSGDPSDGSREGGSWPHPDASQLDEIESIEASAEVCEELKPVVALIAGFKNSASDYRKAKKTSFYEGLDAAVEAVQSGSLDSGKDLAAVALKMNVPEAKADGALLSPADIYSQSAYQGFRDRLVRRVRRLYVEELGGLVNPDTSEASLLDVLYAGGAAGLEESDLYGQAAIRALGKLLNKNGDFDQLRTDFGMAGTSLHPGVSDPNVDNYDWWKFEDFLAKLQVCLCGPKGAKRVNEMELRIRMTPAKSGSWSGAWDLDDARRSRCVFSVSSELRDDGQMVTRGRSGTGWRRMADYELPWGFTTDDKQPSMWFIWTADSGNQKLAKAGDNDLVFKLTGSLTPLLWCWSGQADPKNDDGWPVTARARLKADGDKPDAQFKDATLRLRLLTGAKDVDKDLGLPVRPPKPEGL